MAPVTSDTFTQRQRRDARSVYSSGSSDSRVSMPGVDYCEELAILAEDKCKRGETAAGLRLFEQALSEGTSDWRLLGVLYCHLGNTYFAVGDYAKALLFHRHDLVLSMTRKDRFMEAKASGNLGNILKVLDLYDESFICLNRHLEIMRELGQRPSEGNALFNLGHLYQMMSADAIKNGSSLDVVMELHEKTAEYFEKNVEIVEVLRDKAAQSRVYGNLGNTYYKMSRFEEAAAFHLKDLGDKVGIRRAYQNLGNTHVYLKELSAAVNYFKKALRLAKNLSDRYSEGQACCGIANTHVLLQQYKPAAEYYLQYLAVVRELEDGSGEGNALWSLANVFFTQGALNKAAYFSLLHLRCALKVGDMEGAKVAQEKILSLKTSLGREFVPDSSADWEKIDVDELIAEFNQFLKEYPTLNLSHLSTGKIDASGIKKVAEGGDMSAKSSHNETSKGADTSDTESLLSVNSLRPALNGIGPEQALSQDKFLEQLSQMQGRRLDEQRCELKHPAAAAGISSAAQQRSDVHTKNRAKSLRGREGRKSPNISRATSSLTVQSWGSGSSTSNMTPRGTRLMSIDEFLDSTHSQGERSETLSRILQSRSRRKDEMERAIKKLPEIEKIVREGCWRKRITFSATEPPPGLIGSTSFLSGLRESLALSPR